MIANGTCIAAGVWLLAGSAWGWNDSLTFGGAIGIIILGGIIEVRRDCSDRRKSSIRMEKVD